MTTRGNRHSVPAGGSERLPAQACRTVALVPADDAALARLLHRHRADLLTWLDDYPADQVDPAAVASVRRSIDWVMEQLPGGPGDRLDSLRTAVGLLVDLMWWLDTCGDDEVDPFAAVKLQESTGACLDELSAEQRRRLVEVLDDLAASEHHAGRRYEIRVFAFAMGIAGDEPADQAPAARKWIRPEERDR
jgi:hypothetical protein